LTELSEQTQPYMEDSAAGFLVPASELVDLCAADLDLYGRTFFPRSIRQGTPAFHGEIDALLQDRTNRFCAIKVFRGGAKTTKLRVYTSYRIAYGTSRTILFVSESQEHAIRSLRWLKKHIEHNAKWTSVFGLEKGPKWTDEFLEIRHKALEQTTAIIPLGITGQIRGVNIDDYRPDLIIVDDPCNEENTATPEQRKKISDLFFGALEKSLAPESESPDAKMVLLQTPLHPQDLIATCEALPSWASRTFGCFDEAGESRWPERWTTSLLMREKQEHVDSGKLALWLREKECTIIGEAGNDLKPEWLKFFEIPPDGLTVFMGVDPVPPPSEAALLKGLADKDDEVLSVVGVQGGKAFLLHYEDSRGHTPEWTVAKFFELLDRFRPLRVRVEAVAYQRTLGYLLEKEMRARRRYVQLNMVDNKRKKRHRIVQAYSGLASQGRLFVRPWMHKFIQQFSSYPNCAHDDVLDATALALEEALEYDMNTGGGSPAGLEGMEALPAGWRQAP
jgi:predicted phage terminase large subunit-like protein